MTSTRSCRTTSVGVLALGGGRIQMLRTRTPRRVANQPGPFPLYSATTTTASRKGEMIPGPTQGLSRYVTIAAAAVAASAIRYPEMRRARRSVDMSNKPLSATGTPGRLERPLLHSVGVSAGHRTRAVEQRADLE